MAFPFAVRLCVLALPLACLSIFCCYLGKADEDVPQNGAGAGAGAGAGYPYGYGPQTGAAAGDPSQIVAKALLCFNDKNIYSSCEESYRLTASGNLNVPLEYTNQFCEGPCLSETNLVLNCVEDIMTNFLFYNKATIQDIKETIQAGCSYGTERGNFNVAEHLEAEGNTAHKAATNIVLGLVLMNVGRALLL